MIYTALNNFNITRSKSNDLEILLASQSKLYICEEVQCQCSNGNPWHQGYPRAHQFFVCLNLLYPEPRKHDEPLFMRIATSSFSPLRTIEIQISNGLKVNNPLFFVDHTMVQSQ